MKVFHELLQKSRKKVIGLMSGTSVDGVDAALVEIQEQGLSTQVELIAFKTFPFESEIRTRIFDLFHPDSARVDEICQLNFFIGERFAEALQQRRQWLFATNGDGQQPQQVASLGSPGTGGPFHQREHH